MSGADDMICKTDQIRAAWADGNQIGALRICIFVFPAQIGQPVVQLPASWAIGFAERVELSVVADSV